MAALELVDIVDSENNIVKTVTRKEMRQDKLPHRTSYIAYCDRQGRFLVEVRTLNKDFAPGKFDACVGGVIQHGEDILESAKRELLEEVGIDVEKNNVSFESLGQMKIWFRDNEHYFFGYLYFAKGDAITIRQKEEVSGIMWLKQDELLKLKENCNYDSVIAFEEIMKRAGERGLV